MPSPPFPSPSLPTQTNNKRHTTTHKTTTPLLIMPHTVTIPPKKHKNTQEEMAANPRLTERRALDLNADPVALPFAEGSFDTVGS